MSNTYSYVELIRQALDKTTIIAITDPNGIIIDANERFCELSQYTRDELLGQNHRILNSGHHPKKFFEVMWATICSGKNWEGEILNKAKDGSLYWVHTHIVPFLDSSGNIEKYVSIRYDITAKKNNEKKTWSPSEKSKIYPDNVGLVKFDELTKFFNIASAGCTNCGLKWAHVDLKPFACCIRPSCIVHVDVL